jgi:acyl-CoA thioesterase FadM
MNLLIRLFWFIFTAHRRSRVSTLGLCVSEFRVLPNDLDVLMHMNNGRYFSIMDIARVDLMARSGLWPELKARGWYPVVVHERMSFRRSLKVWQRYTVHSEVLGWDEKHIAMSQRFVAYSGGELKEMASAVVIARFLKTSGGSVSSAELMALAQVSTASPLSAAQMAALMV